MQNSSEREFAKRILNAAKRGQVELPAEERFLIDSEKKESKKSMKKAFALNDRLASKGFSLVEQVRSEKPVDLLRRNVKYIKYTDSRPLDQKKANVMLQYHMKKLSNKAVIRKEREKLTCLREPKKVKKTKGSVFSDKDFQNIKQRPRKKVQNSDGVFI